METPETCIQVNFNCQFLSCKGCPLYESFEQEEQPRLYRKVCNYELTDKSLNYKEEKK